MNTNHRNRGGFVMVFIIIIFMLVGICMIILTGDMRSIMFDTNRAYVRACERNLVASGRAWAAANRSALSDTTQLDTAAMGIEHTQLTVAVYPQEARDIRIEVSVRCGWGGYRLASTKQFMVGQHR